MKKLIPVLSAIICFTACHKTDPVAENFSNTLYATNEESTQITPAALSAFLLPESNDFAGIPQDPRNPLTADKVALGQLLFHESRLSLSGLAVPGLQTYSCATCHHAEAGFQSGLAQAIGEGGIGFGTAGETRIANPAYNINMVDVEPIRTPSCLNVAYSEVMLWNGMSGATGVNATTQSSWKKGTPAYPNFLGYQGVESITMAAETKHRLEPDTTWLATIPEYKNLFDLAFPELTASERITKITVSLAIAAYQRTLIPNEAPFQKWLRGDKSAMTPEQLEGKNLFFSKAKCTGCHSTPGLGASTFFALGMNDLANGTGGAFNISETAFEHEGRGGFTRKNKDMFKFKTPQLYNLKDVHFLGHGASFTSVEQVIRYLNAGAPQNAKVPATQLAKQFKPLYLTEDEIMKLVQFVQDALYDPDLSRYSPASVPSGNCIPNNDIPSKTDRGCL